MLKPLGIKGKLVTIFVLIKVLPLVLLAWLAWQGISALGFAVEESTTQLSQDTTSVVTDVGELAVSRSIKALDEKARETIERLTTDTAFDVADFLYARDRDIRYSATLPRSVEAYTNFLRSQVGYVTRHGAWRLNDAENGWEPEPAATIITSSPYAEQGLDGKAVVLAKNENNKKDFHSRSADVALRNVALPLYLEMTFVDMKGQERIKVTTSDLVSSRKKNVADRRNTYCKAETYFAESKRLKPGEIYVSDVIGEYLPGQLIGPYTPERAEKKGIPFAPETSGYAGKENPLGKRFQGIVRWVTPVFENGVQQGWVTLALDHSHIMEFTDHILPTEKRYSEISDPGSGNYAFMWDYKGRSISHPRDYFIVGYDAQTGLPAVPWLEDSLYDKLSSYDGDVVSFMEETSAFDNQSLKKKPAKELTQNGLVGLDCRFLNFAPQCTGWHNVTQHGGSGSFVIFWSGLWKLTTAATIPYYTGQYGNTPRGFGFVTIGANVHEFHKAATETADELEGIIQQFVTRLGTFAQSTRERLGVAQQKTVEEIFISSLAMILAVIIIAIIMAGTLTRKITTIIRGIKRFQNGELDYRLPVASQDEMGELTDAFNESADEIQNLVVGLRIAEERHRSIIENAVEGIYQSLPKGGYITVNPAMAKIMGYDSSEQMLEEVKDVAGQFYKNSDDRKMLLGLLLEKGHVSNFEFEALKRDGSVVWISTNVRAVRNEDGSIAYLEGMMMDISSRKEMEEAEKQREAAEARDVAKSEFLARMSHEIRTPMNAIIGVGDMLMDGSMSDDQKSLVSLLKSSGEHLLVLVNDILNISQIEAGKLTLFPSVFSVRKTFDDVVALLDIHAQEKGLEVVYTIDKDLPEHLYGDASRLAQVLINLLGNAIKFTTSGSVTVNVRLQDTSDMGVTVFVEVADTGPGIAPNDMEYLFDSFMQADSTSTRQYGGSGLGLAISKALVEQMDGSISVESSVGKGSRFSFTVFLAYPPEGAQEPVQLGGQEGKTESGIEGARLLYVDDTASNRLLLSMYVKGQDVHLDLAESGEEGLDLLENNTYDLLLLDMEMPGLDGYAVARKIRETGLGGEGLPIIALTANAMDGDMQRCLDAGCTGYLAKPVRKGTLLSTIKEYLRKEK